MLAKTKRKKRSRISNEKFGRKKPIPFKDVVERLLQTPPDSRSKK